DSMRYVGLVPILGWTALAFLLDAGRGATAWRMLAAVLITLAALMGSSSPWLRSPGRLIALAFAASLLPLIGLVASRWGPRTRAPDALAVTVVALVFMGVVLWRHDAKAGATSQAFYRESLFGEAAAALDRHRPGTRVAVFGDQWIFPTFGSADHLVSVRLD